jgi:hypothetical protein
MRAVVVLSEIHDLSRSISRQADLPSATFVATIPPLADPGARRDVEITHEVWPALRSCGSADRVEAADSAVGLLVTISSRAMTAAKAASGESLGW